MRCGAVALRCVPWVLVLLAGCFPEQDLGEDAISARDGTWTFNAAWP